MQNHGNYVAVDHRKRVKWLGGQSRRHGESTWFTGFPADSLLVDGDNVVGVRTTPGGLTKDGKPGGNYMPPTDVTARVTVLAEGTRGPLTQAYLERQSIASPNPQIFALGVKELWETKKPLDAVIHTLGWPLPRDAFGGELSSTRSPTTSQPSVSSSASTIKSRRSTCTRCCKTWKAHPLFRPYLEGGEMLEWGAKTIPEGGLHSLPERLHGDGLVMVGDAVGLVDVPSLKGIHYAMHSGMLAARTIYEALKKDDTTATTLAGYDRAVHDSFIQRDLHKTRNMRLGFKSGFLRRRLQSRIDDGDRRRGLRRQDRCGRGCRRVQDGDAVGKSSSRTASSPSRSSDGVFRSGNNTRDDMPSHLTVAEDVPADVARFYVDMCPAAVYEQQGDDLVVNFSNCVDCKTTDVFGARGGAHAKAARERNIRGCD